MNGDDFIPTVPEWHTVQTSQIFTQLICLPGPVVSVYIQLGAIYITLSLSRYGRHGSSVVME